jgi:signal transduction histidine kinase
MISSTDNGVGMTQETLGKLFRLDENYKSQGTAGETGTGLGLILCQEYVQLHGGRIEVESQPGKGTTFTLFLPEK